MWPQVVAQMSAQTQVVVGPWTQTCLQGEVQAPSIPLFFGDHRAMDSNTDPDYSRTTDIQIALSHNLDNNGTIILGGKIGHPRLYNISSSLTLQDPDCLKHWPNLASAWT